MTTFEAWDPVQLGDGGKYVNGDAVVVGYGWPGQDRTDDLFHLAQSFGSDFATALWTS